MNALAFPPSTLTTLRRSLLVATGVFSCVTLVILAQPRPFLVCPQYSELRLSLWLIFSIHLSSFLMLLLHLLYLGCLLRQLGPFLNLFYLYIVGVLIFLQYTLFKNPLPQVVSD